MCIRDRCVAGAHSKAAAEYVQSLFMSPVFRVYTDVYKRQGIATPQRIDEINILQATYEAMREAIKGLGAVSYTHLLYIILEMPLSLAGW